MAKAFFVVTTTLLLLLAGGEGLLRLVADPPLYQRFDVDLKRSKLEVEGQVGAGWMGGLYQTTPEGRRLRSRVDGVVRDHQVSNQDIEIRTNRMGFRGPEWNPHHRPLVLFLGDGITLADHLPEKETFVARVEDLAREQELTWQTQNAGLGAIGVQTQLAILREVAPRIRPDAVVLNLYLDDIQSTPTVKLWTLPPLIHWSWLVQYTYQALSHLQFLGDSPESGGISEEEWTAWRAQARRTVHARVALDRQAEVEKQVIQNFRDWGASWSPSALRRVYESVLQVREESHRYGAPLFVVIHPVRFQVEYSSRVDWPQEKLAHWLAGDRIPYLDLLPRLRSAHLAMQVPLFYDQCRHRPEGADLVGREVYHFLNAYGIRRSYYSVTSASE